MKKIYVYISLFSFLISSYPDYDISKNWITLNDEEIWVGYNITKDVDWCRTRSVLQYNINKISIMIEDLGNYHNVFDRVVLSKIVDDNVVHIRVDMPFPISDRDYIVRYTTNKTKNSASYKFKAAKDVSISIGDDCIRLINAAGEWYIKSIDDLSTEVTYTWNGELRGDFPNWALTRAWKTQGLEMINWLQESLEEKYKD